MPMRRELYPDDWEEIANAVKREADWRCEGCEKHCRRPGDDFMGQDRTLTVAHLDHDPANCDRENLRALCAPCHLRYDAKNHARNASHTRAVREREAGQTALEI